MVHFLTSRSILPNSSGLNSNSLPGNFQSTGTGGSLARFTITHDHLYALDESRMNIYDVTDPIPVEGNTIQLEWGIETIFPNQNNLFIGAEAGMFIYNIDNPKLPEFLSRFSHVRACDPVFVDRNIAYVTLREGVRCTNQVNQIDIIDVSNLKKPELLKSFNMKNPHGLSVLNDVLYLCEGEFGLKVFDVSEPRELKFNRIAELTNHNSYDVIALSAGVLMVIGEDGMYQYDISDPEEIIFLSVIHVVKD